MLLEHLCIAICARSTRRHASWRSGLGLSASTAVQLTHANACRSKGKRPATAHKRHCKNKRCVVLLGKAYKSVQTGRATSSQRSGEMIWFVLLHALPLAQGLLTEPKKRYCQNVSTKQPGHTYPKSPQLSTQRAQWPRLSRSLQWYMTARSELIYSISKHSKEFREQQVADDHGLVRGSLVSSSLCTTADSTEHTPL